MKQINGVGGAFIFSNDARRLSEWYHKNLGLDFEGDEAYGAYYRVFFGLDPDNPSRKLDTTFAIMQARIDLPQSPAHDQEPDDMYGDQSFMINLRVNDLDQLLTDLGAGGITAIKRQDEDYGKFAWIRDVDGNRIELYEPVLAENPGK
jgi:catechol 2,3-dioxygenase-like lactoylglutathione lyase family enzyme